MAAKILSDIMTRHVDTVAPGCLLSTAAWIMKDDRISSQVVVAEGKGIGILTERDILRAMHMGFGYEMPVAELMSAHLLSVQANMEFHAAVRLACDRGIRHLVVADGDGVPQGICTATDFRFHLGHGFFSRHRLEEALEPEPVFLSPQAPILDAVERLLDRGISAAVVMEGRRSVGLIGERTLMTVFAQGIDPETPIGQCMAPPARILQDASLFDAARLMQSSRRRHLVVEDVSGHAIGLLSGDRLIRLLARDYERRDPDDRRFLDKQRRTSDERLRLSLEAVKDGPWDWDIVADRFYLSPLGLGLLDYAPDDVPEIDFATWQEQVHPDDFAAVWPEIESCVDAGESFCVEFRLRRKNGRWLWVHCRGKVVEFDADGHPRRMVGTVSDATERRRMREAMRESRGKYRTILAAMAEGVVIHGADGRIVECNPAAERILGLTAAQILGRDSLDARWGAIHADGSPFAGEAHPAIVALRTGAPVRDVVMGVRKPDTGLSWIRINAEPLRADPNAAPHGVVATFSDITPFFSPGAAAA